MKKYQAPEITIIDLQLATNILSTSGRSDEMEDDDESFEGQGKENFFGFEEDKYGYNKYVGFGIHHDIWSEE